MKAWVHAPKKRGEPWRLTAGFHGPDIEYHRYGTTCWQRKRVFDVRKYRTVEEAMEFAEYEPPRPTVIKLGGYGQNRSMPDEMYSQWKDT